MIAWLHQHKIASLEVVILPQGAGYQYNLVILERIKNKLDIVHEYRGLESFEKVRTYLNKGTPLIINVTGKGILIKQQSGVYGDDKAQVFSQFMPGTQPALFYFDHIKIGQNNILVMARREIIDSLCADFTVLGYRIAGVAIGPTPILWGVKMQVVQPGVINTGTYVITVDAQELISVREQMDDGNDMIQMDATPLKGWVGALICLGLKYVVTPEALMINNEVEGHAGYFIFKQKFKKFFVFYLSILLVVLLVNAIFFLKLSDEIPEQDIQLSVYANMIANEDSTLTEDNNRLEAIRSIQGDKESHLAYYADQIAASMPSQIQLVELIIFPIEKEKIKHEIKFREDIIIIRGRSERSFFLNEWINILKKLSWVENVQVLPYSESADGKGNFDLEIKIKAI